MLILQNIFFTINLKSANISRPGKDDSYPMSPQLMIQAYCLLQGHGRKTTFMLTQRTFYLLKTPLGDPSGSMALVSQYPLERKTWGYYFISHKTALVRHQLL